MDRYDLALLTLLRALLSRRGSAVLADRTGLPGAVAEILAEKTDDDIRGILLSAHRLAAGSADRLSLLGELACLLPELSESMMRSAPKESAPAPDPYALVLSSDGDISAEVRERILKGDITKLVINYSLNCRNSPFQNLPGLREVNFPIAAGPECASMDGLLARSASSGAAATSERLPSATSRVSPTRTRCSSSASASVRRGASISHRRATSTACSGVARSLRTSRVSGCRRPRTRTRSSRAACILPRCRISASGRALTSGTSSGAASGFRTERCEEGRRWRECRSASALKAPRYARLSAPYSACLFRDLSASGRCRL